MKNDQKEERKSETSSGGLFGNIFQKKKGKDQSDISKSAVAKSSINESNASLLSRTSSIGSMQRPSTLALGTIDSRQSCF